MTRNDAARTMQDPAWLLLAEFSLPAEPGSEHRSAEQVTGAVQELGLQPAQVERIRATVLGTLHNMTKPTKHRNQDQQNLTVSVRIWISKVFTEDPSRSSAEARRDGQQERHGWGFFVIQKQGNDPQASAVPPHHVTELFLYQEREHSRNNRPS